MNSNNFIDKDYGLQKGTIVRVTAGRDRDNPFGGFFIVTGFCTEKSGCCLIADGKTRRIDAPKCKNVKHIRRTNSVIDTAGLTDRRLRQLLREFSGNTLPDD